MERKQIAIVLQILLISIGLSDAFLSRNIKIIRNIGQKGDQFRGPSSILSSDGCSQLGAEDRKCDSDSCRCQCVPSRATFTSSNGKWNCINDETIRKQERCGIFFQGEGAGDPFLVQKADYPLMLKGINKSGKTSCGLVQKRTSYMDCNGSWAAPTSSSAGSVFSFGKLQQAIPVLIIKSPGIQFVDGKLIKLWFTEGCELVNKSLNRCLIFKRPGTMSCRILGPNLEESSSTLASSTYDKNSKQGNTYSTEKSGPTRSFPTTYASKVLLKDEGSNKVGTVIAGIVSVVAVLALIIIIFFVLRHRRESKENLPTNYNSGTYEVPVDGAESILLNKGLKGKPHLGLKKTDISSPTYASASCTRGLSKVQNLVYDYAKPDGPATSITPITARESACPIVHDYALPDGPERVKAKINNMAHNYETPEIRTPNNQKEPCYNILEGPDPSSPPPPLYNVLEGPNPNSNSDGIEDQEI